MSKRKITGKVLVVRLGRDESQIVLMGPNSEIIHTTTVATPAGAVTDGMIQNPEAVSAMLKSTVKTPEFKRARKVIFTLCTSQVITETVTLPNLSQKRLDKLIRTNTDMYFPVDMKEYTMVWQTVGAKADTDELSVQLWAIPTAMLSRYYTVANGCGLSLEAVDYCGHSIATAVGASFAQPVKAKEPRKGGGAFLQKRNTEPDTASAEPRYTPSTDLYVTLERDLLGMTFVQENQVVMQRFIQCGSNPAYQFTELSMMVEYFRSLDVGRGSPIRGYLTGALSRYMDLAGELEDVLGVTLTPFASEYDPRWCLCVGALHTELDFGIPSLNKPGKARREFQSQLWQYALLLAGGLAVVLVMLLMLNSRLSWSSEISSLESTRQTLSIQAQKTNGYADNYNNYVSKYNAYSQDWETLFTQLRTYNDNLVLVLQELEDIMPENSSVVNLQIAETGIVAEFACPNKEEAAYLIMELRELQYADLAGITSLSGGGRGAATSYGGEEGEAAPTEGGVELTDSQIDAIVKLFAKNVDSGAIIDVALTLSPDQIELIQDTYGKEPTVQNNTLAGLMENQGSNVTILKRANAINEILTTNYFAMYDFFNLLGEDIMRDEPYLWDIIEPDMMSEENADIWAAIATGTVSDAAMLQDYTGRVIAMLIKNDGTIQATEELLCTDAGMEKWYVYYLEEELGLHDPESYPYLNVDKVIEDLLEGSFDTGDPNADAKLNSLVPEAAWQMLELLQKPETEVKDLPGDLTEEEMIKIVNKYIDGEATEAQKKLVEKVIEMYPTGHTSLDALLKDHLINGEEDDNKNNYILGNYTAKDIQEMIDAYVRYGTTGDATKDKLVQTMLTLYVQKGTTGNKALDALLKAYLSSQLSGGADKDKLTALINTIMGAGGSGSSGGSGSGSGEPQDTRIHFTAAMAYNDELKNAELERKGLDYDDKVEDTIQEKLNGEVDE